MAGTGDDEVDGKLQEWMKIDRVRNVILINLWLQKLGHIIINSEFNMEKQNLYNPLFIEQFTLFVEWEHKGRNAKASRKWEYRPTQEAIAKKNGIWNSRLIFIKENSKFWMLVHS